MKRTTAVPNDLDVSVDIPTDITASLREISSRKLRNATRNALGAAARIIREAAANDAEFPIYSGILRRSLGIKNSKHTSRSIYSLVGARRRFEGPTLPQEVIRKGKQAARKSGIKYVPPTDRISKPSKYLHLMEKGFRHWRTLQFIEGHHMLQKAGQSTRAAVTQKIREKLSEALTKASTASEITTT